MLAALRRPAGMALHRAAQPLPRTAGRSSSSAGSAAAAASLWTRGAAGRKVAQAGLSAGAAAAACSATPTRAARAGCPGLLRTFKKITNLLLFFYNWNFSTAIIKILKKYGCIRFSVRCKFFRSGAYPTPPPYLCASVPLCCTPSAPSTAFARVGTHPSVTPSVQARDGNFMRYLT
jgi:hypothetical protein